ncbi:MAG TPA: tail fiber assembly protein, partial [Buttiauxella sp.]|nr:tail fiber assembly protein [Buttiauxella sp.]
MTFRFSARARTLRVYNLRADTREFIGAGDAYLAPHTGLPADCTSIAPPDVLPGNVAIFDGETWHQVEDHRGETAWHTENGQPHIISEPGELQAGLTFVSPCSAFDIWDGTQWVKDEDAERHSLIARNEELKATLMKEASAQIAILEDAQNLDIATEDELKQLACWKVYRVKLNRIAAGEILDTE